MHRSFTLLGIVCLIAVAAGACGKAGSGGSNTGGAGGGTGVVGTGGTGEGGAGGVGGISGAGVAGSAGADQGDGGDGPSLDAGSDADPNAGDAVADTSDAARDGGTQTPECLAKVTFEYRFILIGTGFDLYEGRQLVVQTADSSSKTCRASGAIRIQDGAFQIEVVNLAASSYPSIDAFVDLDDNGRCSDSVDAKWHVNPAWTSGAPTRTMNLTATNFSVAGNCAMSTSW
jgi:hypothetical protein